MGVNRRSGRAIDGQSHVPGSRPSTLLRGTNRQEAVENACGQRISVRLGRRTGSGGRRWRCGFRTGPAGGCAGRSIGGCPRGCPGDQANVSTRASAWGEAANQSGTGIRHQTCRSRHCHLAAGNTTGTTGCRRCPEHRRPGFQDDPCCPGRKDGNAGRGRDRACHGGIACPDPGTRRWRHRFTGTGG